MLSLDSVIKDLTCKTSYKARLNAIRSINKTQNLNDAKFKQLKDILVDVALNDRVLLVKDEATKVCQKFKIKKNGRDLFLGKKDIGYSTKDIKSVFLRIRSSANMDTLNMKLFKEIFIGLYPEMYDVMLYDKGKKFNNWIELNFKALPKRMPTNR